MLIKGTDLAQAQHQGRFIFLDGFSRLFAPTTRSPGSNYKTINLSSHTSWSHQLAQYITKALREVKGEPALIIEGVDFLLAAGLDNITAPHLLSLLSLLSEVTLFRLVLTKYTSRTFISLFADHNLIYSDHETDLTRNQSVLATSLIHRAYAISSLRPLQTGMAKDVNGVIRMTRGGAWYDFPKDTKGSADEEEWEMLYRIDDGKAKLFKYA